MINSTQQVGRPLCNIKWHQHIYFFFFKVTPTYDILKLISYNVYKKRKRKKLGIIRNYTYSKFDHRRKPEAGATGQGIYITKIVNISLDSIKHKTEGTYWLNTELKFVLLPRSGPWTFGQDNSNKDFYFFSVYSKSLSLKSSSFWFLIPLSLKREEDKMESVLAAWQVATLGGIVSWIMISSCLNVTQKLRSLLQPWVTHYVIIGTPFILQIQVSRFFPPNWTIPIFQNLIFFIVCWL